MPRAEYLIIKVSLYFSYVSFMQPLFMYLNFQAPHAPLQVPDVYRKPFAESRLTGDRQTIAAMIYCMDDAIGSIVDELKATGLYKNTVIIFSTGIFFFHL